jgi:hypothetical protein
MATLPSELVLAPGTFTPALTSLASSLMDALLLRPAAVAIADGGNSSTPSFRSIRERVGRRKYETLSEWKADITEVIETARGSGGHTTRLVCDELDRWFSKRYDELFRLSEFRFRDALCEIAAEMKRARDEYIEAE